MKRRRGGGERAGPIGPWQISSLSILMSRVQLREPVLNDELPGRIITGKVLIKPRVKEVKENSVVFSNTPKEEPIDIIVFATGYTFAFPFLDETVVKVEDGQASLYKYIFPAHLPKPTLAVIGLIKPLGSLLPTGDTQARWAVRVLKGKCIRNRRPWEFPGSPGVMTPHFTVEGSGSIPDWETNISQTTWCGQSKIIKFLKRNNRIYVFSLPCHFRYWKF